ncbi:WYL domain-containing protein [Vibrio scophthalmi]|uniref:WYL domain-containing protein n=1 Tax=Vibrio scophthalmi TaxID=45658 RepID=UPI003AAC4D85
MTKQTRFSTHEHLSVVFEIYQLVPYHFKTTTKEIRSQLIEREIHRDIRTIQRNLNVLVELNLIEKDDRSKPYGYQNRLHQRHALPPRDALIFQLANEHFLHLTPASLLKTLKSRFEDARRSLLSTASANKERQWLKKISSQLPRQIYEENFQKINTALYHNHWLTLHLHETTKLYVMPLGLMHHYPAIELIIGQYVNEQLETQVIAIEHISTVNVSTFTFEYPSTFNVKAHQLTTTIKEEVS